MKGFGLGVPAVLLAVVAAAAVSAVGSAGNAGSAQGSAAPIEAWYDYVRFGGTVYQPNDAFERWPGMGRPLTEGDLGPEVARVAGHQDPTFDPCSRSADGTASDLEAGTPVYEVAGYDPRFRLAARRAGKIVLFEATCSFSARSGAEVLDLRGKLDRIAVRGPLPGGPELASIEDPREVERLAELLLDAGVHYDRDRIVGRLSPEGPAPWIVFHFADGTASTPRAFYAETGELWYGILAPWAFGEAVEQAVAAAARAATPPGTAVPIVPVEPLPATPGPVVTPTATV
jgi:hypothetical protein